MILAAWSLAPLLSLGLLLPQSALPSEEVVSFLSGDLMLQGIVYKPAGSGPFPAILYNHGSARGMLSSQAFEELGPPYASRGWVLFAPYRRGQGLSAQAGPFIGDEIAAARQWSQQITITRIFIGIGALFLLIVTTRRRQRWVRSILVGGLVIFGLYAVHFGSLRAGATTMVRLLETDHLDDQLAALDWLRSQDFVQPGRIAVAGNSFGGVQAVLGAETFPYCAAIDASGGSQSWTLSQQLRTRMVAAVRNSQAPIFFFQAENDYDLAPSRILSEAMSDAGKLSEMKIYPPFGQSAPAGHSFTWLGSAVWADDVMSFLQDHCSGSDQSNPLFDG